MIPRAPALAFALASATLAGGCLHASEPPAVPLYPSGEVVRLPRSQVAEVVGPIAKIDGRDLDDQGGRFELLPGCHIVELERRLKADPYALTNGIQWSGEFPSTTYAIRMKPGAHYVILREMDAEGLSRARISLSAREETASGAATELIPARSEDDIKACKEWERTAFPRTSP